MARVDQNAYGNTEQSEMIPIYSDLMATMLPLHVGVDAQGKITSVGATFCKLMGMEKIHHVDFFDLVTIKRPFGIQGVNDLQLHLGEKLRLFLNHMPGHSLRAVAAAMPGDGVMLNLSFGTSVMDVVSQCNLRNKDFSPADPTLDMIYMIEVQSFVYQQHKEQSQRLQGFRMSAEHQAYTDSLTGLANRRALENHLSRMLRRDSDKGLALMQVDLDFFKAVNDTHGHAAGDFVLQETSRRLNNQLRVTDFLARIGGDEFVIVVSDFKDSETLRLIGDRIIAATHKPIDFDGAECRIGSSIGATIVEKGSKRTAEDILADADRALYISKKRGRGQYNLDRDVFPTE